MGTPYVLNHLGDLYKWAGIHAWKKLDADQKFGSFAADKSYSLLTTGKVGTKYSSKIFRSNYQSDVFWELINNGLAVAFDRNPNFIIVINSANEVFKGNGI